MGSKPQPPRTFTVTDPLMEGPDVRDWQRRLQSILGDWKVDYPEFVPDGVYGAVTRSLTASIVHGFGGSAKKLMAAGVSPGLREQVRAWQNHPPRRVAWVAKFRERHAAHDVASPLAVILQDSWGWHPGVHDGIDLICKPSAPLLAICKATVIRADAGGWWGLGAPSDPAVRSKGDGIIVLRSLVDSGPFREGLNLCYGHAEGAVVKVGQVVEAGEVIGHAGFANAWHVHFMVNGRADDRGVGDRDPKPFVDYARAH